MYENIDDVYTDLAARNINTASIDRDVLADDQLLQIYNMFAARANMVALKDDRTFMDLVEQLKTQIEGDDLAARDTITEVRRAFEDYRANNTNALSNDRLTAILKDICQASKHCKKIQVHESTSDRFRVDFYSDDANFVAFHDGRQKIIPVGQVCCGIYYDSFASGEYRLSSASIDLTTVEALNRLPNYLTSGPSRNVSTSQIVEFLNLAFSVKTSCNI